MRLSQQARRRVVEPLILFALVCAGPFAGFYAENVHEGMGFGALGAYWLACTAIAFAVYLLGVVLVRPGWQRWCAIWATALIAIFSYNNIRVFLASLGWQIEAQVFGWVGAFIAAVLVAAVLGGKRSFHQFLLLFAGLSLLPPLFAAAQLWMALPDQGPRLAYSQAYPLRGNSVWSGEAIRRPNVYWIVLDSYPNEEQLLEHYSHDNAPFLGALESLGFYVAREAYANFSNTRLSVPTMLNMEYPFESGEVYATEIGRGWAPRPGRTNAGTVAAIAGDNRSVAFFKQLGYQYVHFEGRTFSLIRCRGYEEICIRVESAGFSELEASLLKLVPYDLYLQWFHGMPPGKLPKRSAHASGTGIPELGDALLQLPRDSPFFLYAHLSTPHPPFLTDEDCVVGALPGIMKSFARQLRCVNTQILRLLEDVIQVDPEAIILLTADHGPRMTVKPGTPLYRWSPSQIRESLGILNALRLPRDCQGDLRSDLTPINDMRIVFSCLGGHAVRAAEEKHFLARGGPPDGGKLRRVTIR